MSEGLAKYQETSKRETFDKVVNALNNLKKGKKKITYKLVAEKAQVSESILYKTPELVERIKQAKEIQKYKNSDIIKEMPRYQSSKDRKIQELLDQLAKYKQELSEQKKVTALLLGNLEKKTTENVELKTRLMATQKVIKFS